LLLLGWLAAAVMASPRFNPNWSRLPAGTEIPELRTPTSRTYSNGDGTFTADITPQRSGGAESQDSCQPTSTGYVYHMWKNPHEQDYFRFGPELYYRTIDSRVDAVAFAKFDLTPIPDSSTVMAAQFRWYQYEVLASPVRTRCTDLDLDPNSSSDTAVFLAARDGVALAERQFSGVGWGGHELEPWGVHVLQNRLAQNWVALGISPVTGEASSFGICGDYRHTCLHVVYYRPDETDIRALHAELATYPDVALKSGAALLVLTNAGMQTSGTFWAYASLGLARKSTLVEPIAGGETASVLIALPLTPNQNVVNDYYLWATEDHDSQHYNDSTRLQCWSFPAPTYAAEGFDGLVFPPPGWAAIDYDSGACCWTRQVETGRSHSGNGFTSCVSESTGRNDDWLVSSSILPDSDYRDSVGFFVRSYLPLRRDTLEVWALSGSHPSARLLTLGVRDTTYSRHSVSLDTFDGDTVKVAFRYRSSSDWSGLCIDDIWFSRFFVPDTSDTTDTSHVEPPQRDIVQRSITRLPGLAFAPNPTDGSAVTVRCALAVGNRRRLTIRNVIGRAVRTFVLDPSGITRLDLRGFAPGVYFAELDIRGQLGSRKLVITAH
jgi:hypothetical protein